MAQGETYEEFVAKFEQARDKPKTTDDCYTHPETYAAILAWVRARYDLPADCTILRPFFPGGDYEHADYPDGAVVVDNPPFSLQAQILRFFAARGIKYFIFCDAKTAINRLCSEPSHSVVYAAARILYENGAWVATAFETNLDAPGTVLVSPSLREAITHAEHARTPPPKRTRASVKKKIGYPPNIVKFNHLNALASRGIEFRLDAADYAAATNAGGVQHFGGAVLVGDATAEKIQQALRAPIVTIPRPVAPSDITIELTAKDREKIAALNAKAATPWQ